MRALLLLLTAAALAAACAPGAAEAATVSLTYVGTTPATPDQYKIAGGPAVDRYSIRLVAGAGERNRMILDVLGRLRDDGAPLVAGDGCAADAAGWVVCTAAPRPPALAVGYGYEIDAGDADDTVTIGYDERPNPSVSTAGVGVGLVDLGAGDDLFTAPSGSARVQGGPGRDTIVAPLQFGERAPSWDPGAVRPFGGMLWDGGPGPDTASGKSVVVSYAGRTAGVRVTPDDVADDGEPGEGDDIGSDIGVIVGGDGPDELHAAGPVVAGGAGDDLLVGWADPGPGASEVPRLSLRGEAGNDTIQGGPGAELVDGGAGDDALAGGPGNDRLSDGAGADQIDGGEGDDYVEYVPDGAPDVWHGGPGTDGFTSFRDGRPVRAIVLSLNGHADDGPSGEGDDVADGWESLGVEDGSLIGSDAPERLGIASGSTGSIDGGGGDDRLSGGTSLTGGPGRDTIDAGNRVSGAVVHARDGERDLVRCFERRVRVVSDRVDRLLGCTRPEVTASPHGTRALRDRGQLAVDVRCYGTRICAGTLTARAGARGTPPIGRAHFFTAWGGTVRVPLRLGDLPRRPCGSLRAMIRLEPVHGRPTVTTVPLGRCTWRE